MKFVSLLLCLSGLSMAECPALQFDRDTLDLGTIDPGASKHFQIGFKNNSTVSLSLSEAYAQGRGPQQIQFDSLLAPGAKGKLSFDFDPSRVMGSVMENISLQGPNICLYSLMIKAELRPALMISPAQINLGSLRPNSPMPEFDVLVWDPRGQGKVEIPESAKQWFEISTSPSHVSMQGSEVVESAQGLSATKLHLRLKQIPTSPAGRKSISLSIPLHNSLFPGSESFLFAAGWKGEVNP